MAFLSLFGLTFAALGCDKEGQTEAPIESAGPVTEIRAELADGLWEQPDHFCAQLGAEVCEKNDLIVSMISSESSVAAGPGNTIEIVRLASRNGSNVTGHIMLKRGDEGYWTLPPIIEYDESTETQKRAIIKRMDLPEGGAANVIHIQYQVTDQKGDLWDATERTFVCSVDPAAPVACAHLTTMRGETTDGADDGSLPYVEALVVPKTDHPDVYEVIYMKQADGETKYGAEMVPEGDVRIVFP